MECAARPVCVPQALTERQTTMAKRDPFKMPEPTTDAQKRAADARKRAEESDRQAKASWIKSVTERRRRDPLDLSGDQQ